MNIDLGTLGDDYSNVDSLNLGDGEQNITSITLEDVLEITDDDNILRIDGDDQDSINLDVLGEEAEWTLGGFKTDAETGQQYQEVIGIEDDATVTLEISTEIDIQES